ncbi:MAG: hypothetical protein ABI480_02610 [Chitinophagaceae bacterium]
MARSEQNDMTLGLRGRLGKMISFRKMDGQTEAFRRPGKRLTAGTIPQQDHRSKFLDATYYAKGVIANPVKNAVYKEKAKGRRSCYVLAVSDFIKAPEIKAVTTDTYAGHIGDTIGVRAIDDFKVTAVKVIIRDSNGAVLEQGLAVVQPGEVDWLYTCTVANPQVTGSNIRVTATDLPGNATSLETIL